MLKRIFFGSSAESTTDVPQQQAASQPDRASPAPVSKSADSPQPCTLLKTLESDGKPDVYAFAVSSIIKCKGGRERRHHARPVVAVLATFALQMGLLILLWQALTLGSKTVIATRDELKREYKLENRLSRMENSIDNVTAHVSWLRQHALTNSSATTEPMLPEREDAKDDEQPRGVDPSKVNLLAFLALVVYVQDEIRRAVWLSHVAAAYTGILPPFFQTPESKVALTSNILPFWCKAFILVAPLLQYLTGCMVLITSLLLGFNKETQQTVVAVVLSNVALSFIVDLDNRVGAMLASQQQPEVTAAVTPSDTEATQHDTSAAQDSLQNSTTTDIHSKCKQTWSRVCGHCYICVLGFLLLLQPVLLSPGVVFNIYYFTWELQPDDSRQTGGSEPEPAILLGDTTGSSWWEISSMGCAAGRDCSPVLMRCATILSTCLAMILLFSHILPMAKIKSHQLWRHTLLAVQIALYVAATVIDAEWIQSMGYLLERPSEYYRAISSSGMSIMLEKESPIFPLSWFAVWLVMFVLWPVLHTWRKKRNGCEWCTADAGPVLPK